MNWRSGDWRKFVVVLYCLILLSVVAACRSEDDVTPGATEESTQVAIANTPVIFPSPTEKPTEPASPEPAASPTAGQTSEPTVTSPVPTLTPSPSATPSPTPPPEPTSYTIESGDTLIGIAERFGVTIEALAFANGYNSPDELSLIVGEELQIPLCEVHEIVSGNTLAGVAASCGVLLDDLVTVNIRELAQLGSLDAIPLGFLLTIPQESVVNEELDCTALPEREQVIEYRPEPGEGLFCLSQKYDISTTTLLRANVERLTGEPAYGEIPLLIPPYDAALYEVSAEDLSNGVEISDLAAWYEVEASAITDWNGNPVSDPLMEGQQLLIAGANLAVGPFLYQAPE